jgi:hypothetical protein
MPYVIEELKEEQCVAVTYDAAAEVSETSVARRSVADLLRVNQWKRVLIDVTAMKSVPKAAELFALGTSLSQTLPRSARVALVARADQVRHAKLLETVARSHGVLLTWFSDAQRARIWLSEERARFARH